MKTTLNQIRKQSPCSEGWSKLLRHLNKTKADDEVLHLRTILDSNGLDDALWCLRAVAGGTRIMRLYAVWSAKQAEHLMQDERSKYALEVAERHANGNATDEELAAAWAVARAAALAAARDADWDAARSAALAAARAAAWAAARDAAWDAARAAALAAARAAAWAAARDAAWDAAWAAAWDAARDAAWDAAWDAARAAARAAAWAAARDAQEKELRRVLDCMDAGSDPYPGKIMVQA